MMRFLVRPCSDVVMMRFLVRPCSDVVMMRFLVRLCSDVVIMRFLVRPCFKVVYNRFAPFDDAVVILCVSTVVAYIVSVQHRTVCFHLLMMSSDIV